MNFDAWIVDASGMGAVHESGFRVEVEGNPRNPNAVHPGKFPVGLDAITQVRLLRMGVEAITAAAKTNGGGYQQRSERATAPKVMESQKPKPFVVPDNRPKRSTLSLKRKSSEPDTL